MYTVTIRDHIMIAHSFNDKFFGPAMRLHGATYIVDVSFSSDSLNEHNVLIDIGHAQRLLQEVLAPLDYRNLDEFPEFKDALTTTEFMAKYIHDQIRQKVTGTFSGKIGVTLGESHVARASYED